MNITTAPRTASPGWYSLRVNGLIARTQVHDGETEETVTERLLLGVDRLERVEERCFVDLGVIDIGGEA